MIRHACPWLLLSIALLAGACTRNAPVVQGDAAAPSGSEPVAAAVGAGAMAGTQTAANADAGAGSAADATPTQTAGATPAPADFDPASVPVTDARLPPFPFFKTPDGLQSDLAEKDKNVSFDGQHFIAGDKLVMIEGRIFHDSFALQNGDRTYSEREFRKNYENAINALGGRQINTSQYTDAMTDAAGGRDRIEKNAYGAAVVPDYPHDSYLIRTPDKEYWIEVSTGHVPQHGFVVVLERKAMEQSVGFLDAAAMKKAIDANGHVALYINFDIDKATLRPDAQPVIAEIDKLLQSDPSLSLSIEGHTDNTGTREHNQTLSAARARSVLGALVGLGSEPSRLASKGLGQDQPIADNGTEVGRAKNRRVELVKR